ncbi:MAG: hypothetical protein ABJA74_06675 [Lapillicoccus sp.]
MTRELSDLLRAAADDRSRPLPFTPQDIIDRGRRRARRRVWAWTSVWAAAAVGVIVVLTQLLTRPDSPPFPAPPPATSSTSTTSTTSSTSSTSSIANPGTTTTPVAAPMSAADRQLVADCANTVIYQWTETLPVNPSSSARFPTPNPTTSDLTGWRVVLRADDQFGTSAALVSADGSRHAVCNRVHDASTDTKAELNELGPLPTGPVPTSWFDPANAVLVDQPLGWSQICQTKATGKVCPDELYYGVGKAYQGVTRVHIEWPDKTSSDHRVTNGLYVARHHEKRVERLVEPNIRDMQNFPPIYISFYDATGNVIIRYNHNPPMPVPATCPTDHGC